MKNSTGGGGGRRFPRRERAPREDYEVEVLSLRAMRPFNGCSRRGRVHVPVELPPVGAACRERYACDRWMLVVVRPTGQPSRARSTSLVHAVSCSARPLRPGRSPRAREAPPSAFCTPADPIDADPREVHRRMLSRRAFIQRIRWEAASPRFFQQTSMVEALRAVQVPMPSIWHDEPLSVSSPADTTAGSLRHE